MKTKNQNPDFLYLGEKLLHWYNFNGRNLPFRQTNSPYFIWICEVIFQQTQIDQGLSYYNRFVERFPNISALATSDVDEVLLYWKGLGYYSRAINLHKTAQIISEKYQGIFPNNYKDILALPGIGKYTAAAICSICYNEALPAVDGNFYRVLSRLFADDYDISHSSAFLYFSSLAEKILTKHSPGAFNQAMMDLGATICKVANPKCEICPFQQDCMAYSLGKVKDFPVKIKKVKVQKEILQYYFICYEDDFLICQRNETGIWKKLFEFPSVLSTKYLKFVKNKDTIHHVLTHRKLEINIHLVRLESELDFNNCQVKNNAQKINLSEVKNFAFPKPLDNYLKTWSKGCS